MTDIVKLARGYVFDDVHRTHYNGCEAEHVSCLMGMLADEIERLREFERSVALTLPGAYYMDPPDGGDVSLLKQLQRSSIDAARYRLLRRKDGK